MEEYESIRPLARIITRMITKEIITDEEINKCIDDAIVNILSQYSKSENVCIEDIVNRHRFLIAKVAAAHMCYRKKNLIQAIEIEKNYDIYQEVEAYRRRLHFV